MYNIESIKEAIWNNPEPATGLHFTKKAGSWHSRQRPDGTEGRGMKTILKQGREGQIFFNYNGSSFQSGSIWTLLKQIYSSNDIAEVYARAAAAYGIQPTFTGTPEQQEQQRRAWKQHTTTAAIAAEAAGILTNALNTEAGTAIRQYIAGRGLQPSVRMGAFSAALRQELTEKLQRKYEAQDVNTAVKMLFPVSRMDYSKPTPSYKDFADAYGLVLPYFSGCRLYGFCLRLTAAQVPTWINEKGEVCEMPKYLYSISKEKGGIMEKGGYCPAGIDAGQPVYLVEGLLDAEAVMQAGVSNVMAIGGMTPTDNEAKPNSSLIQTLQRYDVKHIVYVPDVEHNADGNLKTAATERTIKNLQPYMTGSSSLDGKGFVSLTIVKADIPDAKDAADIYRLHGAATLLQTLNSRVDWWEWLTELNVQQNAGNILELADNFARLFKDIRNPIERELICRQLTTAPIGSPLQILKEAGITANSLRQIERTGEIQTYRSRMTEAVDALKEAADRKAPAAEMRTLIDTAAGIQNSSAGQSWAAQINADCQLIGAQIAQEGEYIDMCWTLWNSRQEAVRQISFAPANVSVFAAPTSHGKTLVMLQTALYLAQQHAGHVLYVGLENDAKQLYIRALCSFIGDAWQGLQVQNKRRAIRQFFKGQRIIEADAQQGTIAAEAADRKAHDVIAQKVQEYDTNVRPFLHLVRVGNDCEALCDNIAMQVEAWQNNGEDVAAVFIDYCQLLHITGRNYSRADEMKNICDNLNELAKTTGLPIIVGSQMNRSATKSEGNTPALDGIDLNNLGESSGIENIAEDCFLIWDIDRTNLNPYTDKDGIIKPMEKMLWRSKRIFEPISADLQTPQLRRGHVYIESLKGREYQTGCYCLIPADFAAGALDTKNETKK